MNFILLVTLAVVLFATPASADFALGVGTHLFEQDIERNVRIAKELGLRSVRDDFKWSEVEKKRGELIIPRKIDLYLRKSAEAGIAPLMILDYGNRFYDNRRKPVSAETIAAFTRYAVFTAKELRGKVGYLEIWNEWDLSAEPKSPESYYELVKAVAPAIRSVNKDVVILAGAVSTAGLHSGWAERLVKLGVMDLVDGISIHPYIHCERDNGPEAWLKLVSRTSRGLQKANGGKSVPIYITEMGWPSNDGACGSSPGTVAQSLAQALLLVRTLPEVKGFWWYDIKNDGGNISEREHNFGLLGYDYTPKPAFYTLRDLAPYLVNARSVVSTLLQKGVTSLTMTGSDGKKTFALWTDNGQRVNVVLSLVEDGKDSASMIRVGTSKKVPIDRKIRTLNLTLDGYPLLITGMKDLAVAR